MHLPVNSPMTPAAVERGVRAQSRLFRNLHEIVELARRQRLAEIFECFFVKSCG
jgi:hypothetical protein